MPNTTNEEVLWKDRKRILGLPISFTRYEVTSDRLITKRGLFTTVTDEMLLYRVLDIKLVRKLSQKIFGVGTVTLFGADRTDGEHEIKNIKNPEEVRRFFSKIVEHERNLKGITGREMYGAAAGAGLSGEGVDFVDIDGDGVPD